LILANTPARAAAEWGFCCSSKRGERRFFKKNDCVKKMSRSCLNYGVVLVGMKTRPSYSAIGIYKMTTRSNAFPKLSYQPPDLFHRPHSQTHPPPPLDWLFDVRAKNTFDDVPVHTAFQYLWRICLPLSYAVETFPVDFVCEDDERAGREEDGECRFRGDSSCCSVWYRRRKRRRSMKEVVI
jgi:hypothetical protein